MTLNDASLNDSSDEAKSFPPVQANEADRKQLKQIYLSLILIGLVIGALLSFGIVVAMNHFGLTAKPEPGAQNYLMERLPLPANLNPGS